MITSLAILVLGAACCAGESSGRIGGEEEGVRGGPVEGVIPSDAGVEPGDASVSAREDAEDWGIPLFFPDGQVAQDGGPEVPTPPKVDDPEVTPPQDPPFTPPISGTENGGQETGGGNGGACDLDCQIVKMVEIPNKVQLKEPTMIYTWIWCSCDVKGKLRFDCFNPNDKMQYQHTQNVELTARTLTKFQQNSSALDKVGNWRFHATLFDLSQKRLAWNAGNLVSVEASCKENDACTLNGQKGICHKAACCTGCWDGTTCVAKASHGACGDDGLSCKVCTGTQECKANTAGKNVCQTQSVDCVNGATCTLGGKSGTCRNNACCTGCWNTANATCVATTSMSKTACGNAGKVCASCSGTTPVCTADLAGVFACREATPTGDLCATAAENTACTKNGTAGRCHNKACCTGCWNGSSCVTTIKDNACGDNGLACKVCGVNQECKMSTAGNTCQSKAPVCAEGNTCNANGANGICHKNACCTGCWNGSSCVMNMTASACGDNGGSCTKCSAGMQCKVGAGGAVFACRK